MVSGKGKVCDVGTDHAYLPVFLISENICKEAIAGDVADGPLEAARATVEKYGFSDRIEIIKSDGLENISSDGISDVVIAGMGAETISDIIGRAKWLKNSDVNIIIQPMTKIPFMRKWLYSNGFEIIKEEAVCEGEFIYTVMNIKYSGYKINISEFSANLGIFDFSNPESVKYAKKQVSRLENISNGIKKSGKNEEANQIEKIICSIKNVTDGNYKITVGTIYDEINRIAPFSTQDSWDNSGLLVGDRNCDVTGIITALDITDEVIEEAISEKANLIIAHHPVIFHPIKNLSFKNPAVKLAINGISAICVHTPLDKAENGINDMIADMIEREFNVSELRTPIIPEADCRLAGDGRICEILEDVSADETAERFGKMFGGSPVKFSSGNVPVKKLAICSGSGGSLLSIVEKCGCDSYLTGDVKHDVWLEAVSHGINLFDCGHFYTERIAAEYLTKLLRTSVYGINIKTAENCKDVVSYIF